ncbi:peroxide stress protein YaaA [Marinitenerispora sediminis]|uniref:Peroxide stress protein YaaA n=1 Tax=Marinitenerispora sediminis TaxID=1931232 RepID=A0A368TB65_9ACTN|nr:peroxide stress protein YaaA [Marinitenerispora sediminis]RCV56980.1 peroxide stress protein YaaA [Marinitenerispora sediminis]RCV60204.1 peroxide stress protein YaaA [Marinitenerispora sediminis]RCV62109.1 peroxide stress protein YaaA [Marinitenerispora sediminis]
MLILLPPSEGKSDAGDGPPLDLGALSLAELNPARERVIAALAEVVARPESEARAVLGLSATQSAAVERDRVLATAPTVRAAELYTGVLYHALRLPELLAGSTAEAVRDSVLIFSGLWGAVRVTDRLPPYRLSMGVKLPPLGALGAFWRAEASQALTKRAEGRLVVDCRSAAYAAAFRPDAATAARTVTVRVLREARQADGTLTRSVVSHMAKAARGEIAHALLAAGAAPATPRELAGTLTDLGRRVELTAPARAGRPYVLDVVVGD